MERSGMLSPTCSATVRLQRTKLRNEFELAHNTPQLNKHGVVGSAAESNILVWMFVNNVIVKLIMSTKSNKP